MNKVVLGVTACALLAWPGMHAASAANALSFGSVVTSTAKSCDSFSPALAADGNQYTSFGDCNGLQGKLKKKVSMGLGRILGGPEGAQVQDLPTSGLLDYGNRAAGQKPSSALVVGSRLYIWVRNQKSGGKEARLKYSDDFTKASDSKWTFAPWTLTQFGYPVFVQGAPGPYAYIVAHDSNSAYKPADRYVLLRAPLDRLLDQKAYEYFSGTASAPAWSTSYAARSPVFSASGQAYRSGMSYSQARGRYYWWQNTGKTKSTGRFRVLSGPQPWGPWTEVYYTAKWDMKAGEHGTFPVKWMGREPISQPGTLYLLFSGDDRLKVRKATIAAGQ